MTTCMSSAGNNSFMCLLMFSFPGRDSFMYSCARHDWILHMRPKRACTSLSKNTWLIHMFICETWLVYVFICETWLVYVFICETWLVYVFICETRLVCVCQLTHPCDCSQWGHLLHLWDMTHLWIHVWDMTRLCIHLWDMTSLYVNWLIHASTLNEVFFI